MKVRFFITSLLVMSSLSIETKYNTMKKIFTVIVVCLISISVWGYDACVDGIYYNLNKKMNTASVTKGDVRYSGDIIIPEKITYDGNDYSVTSISNDTFYYSYFNLDYSLTSVSIPNSVTSIGSHAFYNCAGITSIIIPDSVTNIGAGAFYGCFSLESIKLPDKIETIEEYTFYDCRKLTSVTVPSTITKIGSYSFMNCINLSSISIFNDINNNIKSIGYRAFYDCVSLKSVSFSNSLTSIDDDAFSSCSSLLSVNLPNSLTSLGCSVFRECSNLKSVTIPNSITEISLGTFAYCAKLTSITIPVSITRISDSAFAGCESLKTVIIPDDVTSVGNWAFKNCSNLASVYIGAGIKKLYSEVFSGCKNLEIVTCAATNVPETNADVFKDAYVSYATLKVPEISLEAYKSTEPWSEFGTFKTIEGGDVPEIKKCVKPTIIYADKKLFYSTETDDADIVSEVTVADAKKSYDKEVPLTASYNITAYATKSGYDDSDKATATLVWATGSLTDGINPAKMISVDALPLLISQEDGMVNVSGLAHGDTIIAYSSDGRQIASAKAVGNAALMNLSSLRGHVAVFTTNGRTAKVMIK